MNKILKLIAICMTIGGLALIVYMWWCTNANKYGWANKRLIIGCIVFVVGVYIIYKKVSKSQ